MSEKSIFCGEFHRLTINVGTYIRFSAKRWYEEVDDELHLMGAGRLQLERIFQKELQGTQH